MTEKSKKDIRLKLLKALQQWHADLGILDFPKRYGISTNEKKYREISFRVKKGANEREASVEDIVSHKQPIFGMGHSIVGYAITYRVWLPTEEGKFAGYITIRFSLNPSIVGIVKVGEYFIAVEHDNFPLQKKTIGLPRMFGVSKSEELDTLGNILLSKEYPFLLDYIKSVKVSQLGKTIYTDPTSRFERTVSLLIELELQREVVSKEDLANYISHRNKEMLLHHIFTEDEVKDIYLDRAVIRHEDSVTDSKQMVFIEQFSLWALAAYFSSKYIK